MGVLEALGVMRELGGTVDLIAQLVMGLFFAFLSWLVIGWLWPAVGLASFIIYLISEVFSIIGVARLHRYRGLVRASTSGWKSIKVSDYEKYNIGLRDAVWGYLATFLWGPIAAFLVAGIVGKLLPEFRGPIFFLVLCFWSVVVLAPIPSRHTKVRS